MRSFTFLMTSVSNRGFRGAFGIASLACLCVDASAHHSVSAFFERGNFLELEGYVTDVAWMNPHTAILIVVETERGREEWELVAGSVNSLQRRDITRETIEVGNRIRVAGWPSRRDVKAMYVTNMLMANGREYLVSGVLQPHRWTDPTPVARAQDASSVGAGIFRVWRVSELYKLRRPMSLTPAARRAREAWDPLSDDPVLDCIAPGMPNSILNPYPIEFVDEGDQIRLLMEEWDGVRFIHMSSVEVPDAPGPQGHSVGRWDAGTLIVETTHVDWPWLDGDGTPMSDDIKIVERFTISDGERRLDYEITVTDPANLVAPAIYDGVWILDPGVTIKPFACRLR